MHHPTDRITHTMVFVTPVVEHWLERPQCSGERIFIIIDNDRGGWGIKLRFPQWQIQVVDNRHKSRSFVRATSQMVQWFERPLMLRFV